MHCPVCEKGSLRFLFSAGVYEIRQCSFCHLAQTITPRGWKRKQVYEQEDLEIYLEKEDMFRELFRNTLRFIRRFTTSDTLVDVGAGVGLFVSEATKAGFEATGYEPSKDSVKAAKKYFGVTLKNTEFSARRLKKPVDCMVINHVLEHIQNPKQLLKDIHARLEVGGTVFVGVPNFGSLLATAKKARWQSLIPEQHRWHFTKQSLDMLVLPMGFRRVGIQIDNHDRSIHPLWKRPLYFILDTMSQVTKNGEAILVAYQKI